MTTLDTLRAARKLLSDPARWTKKVAARGVDGNESIDIKDGVCFCAVGAVWHIAGWAACSDAEDLLDSTVRAETKFRTIPGFNDHPTTTHADVLRVYDAAIALAEAAFAGETK